MNLVSASEIEQMACAHWPELLDAAGRSLIALASGSCEAPLRTALPLASGTLLTMPGRLTDSATALVKLISVVPENPARGRPATQGVAVLFDGQTGEPLSLLDGRALTAVRTPAVTVAAVRALAGSATNVAVIGSGMQAEWHARAFDAVFHPRRITVASRTPAHRDTLVAKLRTELQAEILASESIGAAVHRADVILCCTSASLPFLQADMLRAGPVTVAAVGAFTPAMAEVSPSVFRAAGKVYVDDREACLHEAGDVIQAVAGSALSDDDVVSVGGAGRDGRRVKIFKSVGSAIEDAAVAAYLCGSN
jgi:alanine dehydrogenase